MTDSVDELLDEDLRQHGGRDLVLSLIENPDWSNEMDYRHDWRIDVPPVLRKYWNRMSRESRLAVYLTAVANEERS